MIRGFTSPVCADEHAENEVQLNPPNPISARCSVLTQGERNLLMQVEEVQNRLTELRRQLLFKKSQVADAKAELDLRSRSVREVNKCSFQLPRFALKGWRHFKGVSLCPASSLENV